jgi:hypothetical protein
MRFLLVALLAACASRVPIEGPDAARLRPLVEAGQREVVAYFGAPFAAPYEVRVFADRAALDAHLRVLWNDPSVKTECWMVGMGAAAELVLLAPSSWKQAACEHDARDEVALARLVTHELVHVYHSQRNPSLEAGTEEIQGLAWFVEGLAVVVSGQLDEERLAAARAGTVPAKLADFWSGPNRYGLSGSVVRYLEARYGRAKLASLLSAPSPAAFFAALGLDDTSLLSRWREHAKMPP